MPKSNWGFAHMKKTNPERLAAISASGGASVSPSNRSFSQDKELAREAGRKGGSAKRKTKA